MNEPYQGQERRQIDIDRIQQEARDRAEKEVRLSLTIESLQKTIEGHGVTIQLLMQKSDEHFRAIESKLAEHREETEEANRQEFSRVKTAIGHLQARLDPIEQDFLRREKEKQDAIKRTQDTFDHGKKVAVGAIILAILGSVGGFAIWLVGLYQSRPGG